jgi:hypothetical protein
MMLELSELHFVRMWDSLQGLRMVCREKPDPESAFLYSRATDDLRLLARAIKAHAPGTVTDAWLALMAAVDMFDDCDLPAFTTPDARARFDLQHAAFMAGYRAGSVK